MATDSLWRTTYELPRYPRLEADREADVAIVGGGITGLTAAVLLARSGKRIVLLERDRIGSGETGNTTSHLTEAIDARYHTIIRTFGEDAARLVARSSREAIDWIEQIASRADDRCGFGRVSGYLYTERAGDLESLADELDAARRAGCHVEWSDDVPLPIRHRGGIRWFRQGQVHATRYLDRLVEEARAAGAEIFERTPVIGVRDGEPCEVETEHGIVRARSVVVAAHVPINNRVLLHTKLAAYRSYVVAAEADEGLADGLFWDTDKPYHYIRSQTIDGRTFLIAGGEDHRTGARQDTDTSFDALLDYMQERFGIANARFQWSGQIIEPVDGLPFIGPNAGSRQVYVATGYAGNGMTFGTVAGMVIADAITGKANAYAALYDATRIKPVAAALDYVKENAAFPARLMTDRLTSLNVEEGPVQSLRPGDGGIFNSDEGKIAVCRGRDGVVHAVSAVCTHLGCDVAWNQSEQTWDCPCHGSRYSPEGRVINGPAVMDLRRVPVTTGAR